MAGSHEAETAKAVFAVGLLRIMSTLGKGLRKLAEILRKSPQIAGFFMGGCRA